MLVNLNDVLKPARENHYGVGLFNVCSLKLVEQKIVLANIMKNLPLNFQKCHRAKNDSVALSCVVCFNLLTQHSAKKLI